MNSFECIMEKDELVALDDVPDLIEPVGCGFFKNKSYKIKRIDFRNNRVTLKDEYDSSDSFSVDLKYKGSNYLWDWFRKV